MLELELARNGDLARYHRVIQKASTFTTCPKLPMFFEAWIHRHLYEDGCFPKIFLSLKRVGCHSLPLRFEDIRLHDVVRLECRVRDDDHREVSPRVWFEIERLDVIAREPEPVADVHDVDGLEPVHSAAGTPEAEPHARRDTERASVPPDGQQVQAAAPGDHHACGARSDDADAIKEVEMVEAGPHAQAGLDCDDAMQIDSHQIADRPSMDITRAVSTDAGERNENLGKPQPGTSHACAALGSQSYMGRRDLIHLRRGGDHADEQNEGPRLSAMRPLAE
ncbi:hypothetical protein K466DRAFT_607784 [Polyporus arcularius HHB13444]|uniref:Uncharacterized protein n=1 Tax=Polyporus arcularius HHB13444 TaxID=1314778 RepID=A0A5C3NW20_9APHY|nr:hypothetical protein K466DRAFT_607784 [Polyporus arcularius HHB13444]